MQNGIDNFPIKKEIAPNSRELFCFFGGVAGLIGMPVFEFASASGILDASRVFVRDLSQAWYHRGLGVGDSTLEGSVSLLGEYVEKIHVDKKIFVGNSMGGYAAIVFGALLGADRVVVFSPQTLISHEGRLQLGDARWGVQMGRLHALIPNHPAYDLVQWLSSCPHPVPRIDLHVSQADALDLAHARRMASVPNVILHEYRAGGHELVKHLRNTGQLPIALAGHY